MAESTALALFSADNVHHIVFIAPQSMTSNVEFTWPTNTGNLGDVLSTDGNGGLSWVPAGGGPVVDLGYIASMTGGTVTNTAGADAFIPLSDNTNAGLILNTPAFLLNRANHTGTQLLATISDAGTLAGLNTVSTANIGNDQVTYAKIQNVSAASRLLGRGSAAGAGDVEEITLGPNLTMINAVLDAVGTGGTASSERFTANDAILPTVTPPEPLTRNNHFLLGFDDTTVEAALFESMAPSGYAGGAAQCLIDWAPATAASGDVIFGIEFERKQVGGESLDVDGFATRVDAAAATATASGVPVLSSMTLTQVQMDGIVANNAYRIRITRRSDLGGDTMVGDAQLMRATLIF